MDYIDPFEEVLSEIIDYWEEDGETFERICKVIFDIDESTSHIEIAEKANCSNNAVKKHLDRLAELGVVEKNPQTKMARYQRNSAYIEWRVLRHIINEYSLEEIIGRVEALEDRKEEITGGTSEIPSIVSVNDVDLCEPVSQQMEEADELEVIKQRLRLYELARQSQQNDGHLVSREF